MRRQFVTTDVFTTRKGAGNPLAVVLDSVGLTDTQMQTIAREFNISETTFVIPSAAPDQPVFVRIFTPARELPFAGHPVVGTAVILAERVRSQTGQLPTWLHLEVPLGKVEVDICTDPSGPTSAVCAVPKLPIMHANPPTDSQVAVALSLPVSEIDLSRRPIQTWDAGYAVTFVALKSKDAVSKAKVDLSQWPSAAEFGHPVSVFPYVEDAQDRLYARMFAPAMGIPEDPATGGAVAALAGHIHAFGERCDGTHHVIVEQGVDMGRPSTVTLELRIAHNALDRVRIGGPAVEFFNGSFEMD
jgi:trans-2,3-dihydro-3-hydroxyanthranilate isomerase